MPIVTELGAIPVTQYSVMGGGRFFPMVSREVSWIVDPESDLDKLYCTHNDMIQEIAQAVKDVEVVIIIMSTGHDFMTHFAQEFFNYMFNENLAEKCQYVVLRITNPEESRGRSSRRRSRRSNPQPKVDAEAIMRLYGLEREKIKAKICKFIKYLVAKEA